MLNSPTRMKPLISLVWTLLSIALPAAAQTETPRAASLPGPKENRTVTASRISGPLKIDGRFDDEVYQRLEPFRRLIQQDPKEGEPASEDTDFWVMFDDKNIYFAAKCYDTHPEREVATELRRDSNNIFQNDSVAIVIDTFHDSRNGYKFQTNSLGAIQESAVVDEINNDTWNTVWDVRSARYDWGWGFEMSVPFKSLRYPGAGPQTWGINMRRVIKWKNEISYLIPMQRSWGANALYHMGFTATLLGIETPAQSMNLEVKPYVVSSLTTDHTATTPFDNKSESNSGFDFKYGLTRGLILDTTYRTDFAQVEEDQQQVNLTRYSLFFPEKRDFFLEGQAIFAFGGTNFGQNANPGDVPVIFFSRRIGLNNGLAVPVNAGARITGRAGKYQLGIVNIQTGDKPAANAVSTNFSAFRIKRDILRRSNIGLIATYRSPTVAGHQNNAAVGADANLFLLRNIVANLYYARTDSPGRSDGQGSYRGRFDYTGDRYGFIAEHLLVGPAFNPEIGFVRRSDFRRTFEQVRFSPRPKNARVVRRYNFHASLDYLTNASWTTVLDKVFEGQFGIEFQRGDTLRFTYDHNYEFLPRQFVINPGTIVPGGGYLYQDFTTSYFLGQQRRVSGSVSAGYGSLYNGRKTEAGYNGRIAIVPQFAVEPSIALNRVRLPYGDFEAPVITTRAVFTPNARTALTTLIQYNGGTHTLSSSVRLRWEYSPRSELFLVYSDGRNTLATGYQELLNRSIAFKITRLLRF
jgi:Domain of unknown function (DUF5916)/Carbohydrate family 9 binding domain-like